MRNQLSIPEEIEPGAGNYSFRTDLKVNGWSWVAVLTSFVGEVFLLPQHPDWPTPWRTLIAIAPIVASLLWVRSAMRWMRGMDELQLRITMAAMMFAVVTSLFVLAGSRLLAVAGALPARFQPTSGFIIIWLVVCFYLLGRAIFNRRYQ